MDNKIYVDILEAFGGYIVKSYMKKSDGSHFCEKSILFENLSDAREYKRSII